MVFATTPFPLIRRGHRYSLSMSYCIIMVMAMSAAVSGAIHINQIGYATGDDKHFLATNASGNISFAILDQNNAEVFTGSLAAAVYDSLAGELVRIGSFTSFKKTGEFKIKLSSGIVSEEFPIGNNILENLYQHSIHALYLSRCGYAVEDDRVGHPACHLGDGGHRIEEGVKIADSRDVHGAWHNGGDYRRSTQSAAEAISRLLWIAELFADKVDLPASLLKPGERTGNLPDLLIEARWGLDWLMRMMDDEGGVSLGLGPAPEDPVMPPFIAPQDDVLHNYIGSVYSANTFKAGAVLARASRLLQAKDAAFASKCLAAAKKTWAFLQAHPNKVQDDNTCQIYKFNNTDADDRMWLAIELFRATGQATYHDYFKQKYYAPASYPSIPTHTHVFRMNNYHESLISYALDDRADTQLRKKIIDALSASCDKMVLHSDSSGYGYILPRQNWDHRHTIGNNLHLAFELVMLNHLADKPEYLRVARRQLDYILGANPLSKLFVTGMEPRGITTPHYRPFVIKNLAPVGFTVKGPTNDAEFIAKTYTDEGKAVPPPMKAYVDNRGAHWCNEPDIELQGYLVFFTGYFHFLAQGLTAGNSERDNKSPRNRQAISPLSETTLDIAYDLKGRTIKRGKSGLRQSGCYLIVDSAGRVSRRTAAIKEPALR